MLRPYFFVKKVWKNCGCTSFLGNLHDEAGIEALSTAEFPQELITDWSLQAEQFLPTVDSGEPMPQLQ